MAVTAGLVAGLAVAAPTSATAATDVVVFDDMEHGDVSDWGFNGWFNVLRHRRRGITSKTTGLPNGGGF